MSNGRPFSIRLFVWSVVLVAVAAAGIYLSYELVVKPQRVLQDQISEQKETILRLEQEKQRLEAYLKIEEDDPFKGRALMLFRRIFSSTMRPEDGFVIDVEGQAPEAYAEQQAPSGFEKDLWKRFWDLANDEKLAKEHGVRAIHGDAPYMRLEPDRVYEVCLRSTGEVIITPGPRLSPPQTTP
jgi:hypothetical protein